MGYVFWCDECCECSLQLGKGLATFVIESFILAMDDVVFVFVVGRGQHGHSHTVGASWVNRTVPVVLTDGSGGPLVCIFVDMCSFVVLEFLEGGVKGKPSDGVENIRCPVWVLLHDICAKL